MSIKSFFNKLFGKEEEQVFSVEELMGAEPEAIPTPSPPREATHQEAVRMKKGREAKPALIDAFYGTLVDRDPSETALKRKKHLHDGWREGFSHPFEFEGRVYDVQKRRDDSREQFEELMARLEAMAGE